MATNLIKRSPNSNNHEHHNNYYKMTSENSHRPTSKQPTNGIRNHDHNLDDTQTNTNNNNDTNNYRVQSKRSISAAMPIQVPARQIKSASLPIQVPARQIKKDLNKLRLNMMNRDLAAGELDVVSIGGGVELGDDVSATCARRELFPRKAAIKSTSDDDDDDDGDDHDHDHHQHDVDDEFLEQEYNENHHNHYPIDDFDVDEFLEQEYNDNHHNHYPIDEFDDEHLTADENPMKLFASIQALAKSLHEDAELFGSLPPKRLLESPIRSMALSSLA